jgi:O-antigen/teichoic acid export membrane protein
VLLHGRVSRGLRNSWHELAWIFAGQLIGALAAIVSARLLTSLLRPAAYGELTLGVTIAALVTHVVLGPLGLSFERYFSTAREKHELAHFLGSVRAVTGQASLLIGALGLLLGIVLRLLGRDAWVLLALEAVTFALISGWEYAVDAVQNAAQQRAIVAWHQALRSWLRPLSAGALLVLLGGTSSVAMLGFCLASVLVLLSELLFFRKGIQRDLLIEPRLDGQPTVTSERLIAYALPLSLAGVFTWAQLSSDRWALDVLSGPAAVGLYAVVFLLGSYPLTVFGQAIVQLAAPLVFLRAGDGTDPTRVASAVRLVEVLVGIMLALILTLAVGAELLHDLLFEYLVAAEYRSASTLLPLAVLAGGALNVGQVLALIPMALGNSRALLAPRIGSALLAIGLNIAGAYVLGAVGVLVAGVIVGVTYALWTGLAGLTLLRRSARGNGGDFATQRVQRR